MQLSFTSCADVSEHLAVITQDKQDRLLREAFVLERLDERSQTVVGIVQGVQIAPKRRARDVGKRKRREGRRQVPGMVIGQGKYCREGRHPL